jgi:hypothetical protein
LQFQRNPYGTSPSKSVSHRRAHSSVPISNTHHKRSGSHHSIGSAATGGSDGRKRSNSQQQHSEDVFLHGVVAQTRFV